MAGAALTSLAEAPPATRPARLPPRALLTDEQYKQLADELRAQYLKPPADWPPMEIDPSIKHPIPDIGPLEKIVYPEDNPESKPKAELGKLLFFDPRLSGSGAVACASCHDPDLAWADGKTVSFGHDRQAGKRNAPSLVGAAFQKFQFWDGRARTLEEQALFPITDQVEMHAVPETVIQRLSDVPQYRAQFKAVFGDESISMERIAQAIATFERTIIIGQSPWDAFLSGRNKNALNDSAIRGLHLFRTKARCINCHNGPTFTDSDFHSLGLTYYKRKYEDLGRYHVTNDPKDVGKFKTPSLRNVARTAPYMHNGLFDLEGVINMYNAGNAQLRPKPGEENDPMFPRTDPLLRSLGLNKQDKADLIAFLETLSERKIRIRPPELPTKD